METNPYAPPLDIETSKSVDTGSTPKDRWGRWIAAVLAITGTPFLPLAILPCIMPGLLMWIVWLLIAFNVRRLNCAKTWEISLAWNLVVFLFVVLMRIADKNSMQGWIGYAVFHLLLAIVGSLAVLSIEKDIPAKSEPAGR